MSSGSRPPRPPTPTRWTQADYNFHWVINLGADSPKLVRSLLNTLRLIPHQYYRVPPHQLASTTKAHAKILKAIVAHDAEAARKAAQQHILDLGNELIKNFDDNGYWVPSGEGAPSAASLIHTAIRGQ